MHTVKFFSRMCIDVRFYISINNIYGAIYKAYS